MAQNCLIIFKNCIYWLLCIILLSLPLALLTLWKFIITVTVRILYPNWVSFDIQDAMTLGDVPNIYTNPLLNIGLILKIDGPINIIQFREHFSKCLLQPVELTTGVPVNINLFYFIRTFCGYAFKQRVKFRDLNLNELIAEVEEKEDLIWNFFYSPYEKGKPLWNVGISNTSSESDQHQTTLLFRLHHSMGDGYSLIYLFETLAECQNLQTLQANSFNETFVEKIGLIASAPTTLQEFGKSTNAIKNPLKMSGIDTEMHYLHLNLDLGAIKVIRKKTGATISSILLTLLGGTIRRTLLETKIISSEDKLPAHIYSGHPLPWPSHPRNKMCNEWTIGIFKVPIKNANPLERLIETDKDFKQFHSKGTNKLFRRILVPLMSLVPLQLTSKMNEGDLQFSTSWSGIVAGNNYKLLGNKISNIYPFVGLTVPKIAVTVISLSHSRQIDITIGINKELSKDEILAHQIVNQFIPQELNNLLQVFNV